MMKKIVFITPGLILAIATLGGWATESIPTPTDDTHLERGVTAFQLGDYVAAERLWSDGIHQCQTHRQPALMGELLARRGEAAQALGHIHSAITDLGAALNIAEQIGEPRQIAAIAGALGNAYFLGHQPNQAMPLLDRSLALAREHGFDDIEAVSTTNLGNLWASMGVISIAATTISTTGEVNRRNTPSKRTPSLAGIRRTLDESILTRINTDLARSFRETNKDIATPLSATDTLNKAIEFYTKGMALAKRQVNHDLMATISVNLGRLYQRQGKTREALTALFEGLAILRNVSSTSAVGNELVAIGRQAQDLPISDHAIARQRQELLLEAFRRAQELGDALHDQKIVSQAYGYIGQEYEQAARWQEAAQLTDQAAFAAAAGHLPELLFRWEWQRGRIFNAVGNLSQALDAYRRAVTALESIRQDIPIDYQDGRSSFRETLGPLFTGMADLLMRLDVANLDPEASQKLLREAQKIIELLKVAEMDDYFKDRCAVESRQVDTSRITKNTAVVYPIPLPDRLEILVDINHQLIRKTSPISSSQLSTDVKNLRAGLEDFDSRNYLISAKLVFDNVLRPIEAALQQNDIHTIVFVPDGVLRLIPLAALHNGKHFVIEDYAVATIPGLSLVDIDTKARPSFAVLAAGISESVHGADALPSVINELDGIHTIFQSKEMRDKQFLLKSFTDVVENQKFTILHIASHGFFSGDPEKSFVLTYDDYLTMNHIERTIKSTQRHGYGIDLLTLSACSTAAGDDRSALGLGGVAVKAGAQSAMGSLWPVNDTSTAILIPEFYQRLHDQNITKAEALRQAQLILIHQEEFSHPAMWAPFLMIGNWL